MAEVCITSAASAVVAAPPAGSFTLPEIAGIGVIVHAAPGDKCQRCWRILPEVGTGPGHPDLCLRCGAAVEELGVPALAAVGRR